MLLFRGSFIAIFLAYLRLCAVHSESDEKSRGFQAFMDITQNPCKNFYGYACGKWKETLKETNEEFRDLEGYMKLQYLQLFANGFERRMRKGITETGTVYKKIQDIYDSCRKTLNLRVFQYIEILRSRYTDLSFLEILHNQNVTFTGENHNWLKVLGLLRSHGFNNAILSMNIVRLNATASIVQFSKPEKSEFDATEKLALEPLDPEFRSKIVEFKQQLESAAKETSHGESGLKSFSDLAEYFPTSSVNNYLEILPLTLPIDKLEFKVKDIEYVRGLQAILSETPESVLAYFIGLKFVSYLREKLPKSNEPFDCLTPIKDHIPEILDFIYSEQFYSGQRKVVDEILDQIFRNLKTTYLNTFKEYATNFTDPVLTFLQEKILFMELNVGQLPKGVGMEFYENYLKELEVEAETLNSFYNNHLSLMRFRVARELKQLSLGAKENENIFNMQKIAPFYDIFSNVVIHPFSLLTEPLFNSKDDRLFHYAGIGSIMAHDMAHAFDTNGLKYDAHGNPSEVFEGILRDNIHFQKALACLQKSPTLRLDEKIAEFVGSRVGYKSYFEKPELHAFEAPWNMTRKQVFFVKFSQFYCVTEPQTSNEGSFKWLTDIVENNKEFYEAFNCDEPNNHETCDFW